MSDEKLAKYLTGEHGPTYLVKAIDALSNSIALLEISTRPCTCYNPCAPNKHHPVAWEDSETAWDCMVLAKRHLVDLLEKRSKM